MVPTQKHPHINAPSENELRQLIEGRPAEVRDLYLATHRLVLDTLPGVVYAVDCKDGQLGYGARQYGYNGWGMAALGAHSRWVSLAFMRGAALDDPAGLLEGAGKSVRHVKVHSRDQLTAIKDGIAALLEAAARLNHA